MCPFLGTLRIPLTTKGMGSHLRVSLKSGKSYIINGGFEGFVSDLIELLEERSGIPVREQRLTRGSVETKNYYFIQCGRLAHLTSARRCPVQAAWIERASEGTLISGDVPPWVFGDREIMEVSAVKTAQHLMHLCSAELHFHRGCRRVGWDGHSIYHKGFSCR